LDVGHFELGLVRRISLVLQKRFHQTLDLL
jgi:hypothetical protein